MSQARYIRRKFPDDDQFAEIKFGRPLFAESRIRGNAGKTLALFPLHTSNGSASGVVPLPCLWTLQDENPSPFDVSRLSSKSACLYKLRYTDGERNGNSSREKRRRRQTPGKNFSIDASYNFIPNRQTFLFSPTSFLLRETIPTTDVLSQPACSSTLTFSFLLVACTLSSLCLLSSLFSHSSRVCDLRATLLDFRVSLSLSLLEMVSTATLVNHRYLSDNSSPSRIRRIDSNNK